MTTEEICRKYYITNYSINPDGSIDVYGDVNLYGGGLIELPLRFNKVSGDFDCGCNYLTTLKQDGLTKYNYKEFQKLYKRKLILDELYTRHM